MPMLLLLEMLLQKTMSQRALMQQTASIMCVAALVSMLELLFDYQLCVYSYAFLQLVRAMLPHCKCLIEFVTAGGPYTCSTPASALTFK